MELCGAVYRAAVEAALTTGIDGFDSDERQKVRGETLYNQQHVVT